MSERYSDELSARDLLERLLPGVDAALLLRALHEEAAHPARPAGVPGPAERDLPPAARELYRVRRDLALGRATPALQHALNNPLAALLAEAQMLELDAAGPEARAGAARVVELTRRVVALVRGLGTEAGPSR